MKFRLVCLARLRLTSPLQIGSGRQDIPFTDRPVVRDVRGIPFIPGGTLAGALAASLNKRWRDWLQPADKKEEAKPPKPSPLIVDDAYPLPAQEKSLRWPVEIRDQVTLKHDTLTAKPDHYFRPEVLPVGTIFRFACRGDFRSSRKAEGFLQELGKFLAGGGALGGKQSSGSGRWHLQDRKLAYRILDLSQPEQLKFWLGHGHGFTWDGKWSSLRRFGFKEITMPPVAPPPRSRWQLVLGVEIKDGLHLSGGATGLPRRDEADLRQAERVTINGRGNLGREYVDYGSAVKGRLRSVMEMLLRTYLVRYQNLEEGEVLKLVPVDPNQTSTWPAVRDFFGFREKRRGKKGAWQVEERPWHNPPVTLTREDHICLDEFTQQVVKTAKFVFSPLNQGVSKVIVSLPAQAPPWQKTLLAFAAELLCLNLLPWGGHASRGYLGAKLTLEYVDGFSEKALINEVAALLKTGEQEKS
ncbi:MAG: RAMP superfamily CRISPR-associated protein [Thermodesulfobacteriota bacterium]